MSSTDILTSTNALTKANLAKVPARMVGGMRKAATRGVKKIKPALVALTELLNDREYQMSKEIPDLTSLEFLSNSENHKYIENPIMRISSKLQLLFIKGKMVDMPSNEKENLVMPVFPTDNSSSSSGENKKKEEGRFQRRFKPILNRVMKDYTMNEIKDIGVCRAVIQSSPHVVKDAKVFQVNNGNLFLVWGDLVMSGIPRAPRVPNNLGATDADDSDSDLPELTNFEDSLNNEKTSEASDENEENSEKNPQIPDGMTFTQNDVELVCENSGCSKYDAIQELILHNGDLINTIMAFTAGADGSSPAQIRAEIRKNEKRAASKEAAEETVEGVEGVEGVEAATATATATATAVEAGVEAGVETGVEDMDLEN